MPQLPLWFPPWGLFLSNPNRKEVKSMPDPASPIFAEILKKGRMRKYCCGESELDVGVGERQGESLGGPEGSNIKVYRQSFEYFYYLIGR
jgi:hypothetical protein